MLYNNCNGDTMFGQMKGMLLESEDITAPTTPVTL